MSSKARTAEPAGDQAGSSLGRLVALAPRLADVPAAFVSVTSPASGWTLATWIGGDRPETRLWRLLSEQVALDEAPVIVNDAASDVRLKGRSGIAACAGFPLRAEDGSVTGVFGVAEVVARKWAPADLLALEDLAAAMAADVALHLAVRRQQDAVTQLGDVLDLAHDAYVAITEDGLVTAWNASAERLFGYPPGHALGRPVADLIIPERMRAAHDAGLARIRSGGQSRLAGQRLELIAVDRDGREFPIEMTLQMDAGGGRAAFHAFLHDISGRKAAQRALEDERTFLQSLLESLDSGVAACGADGRLALFNQAMREIHGTEQLPLAPEDWAGTYHLYGPDGRAPLAAAEFPLARAFGGEQVKGEQVVVRPASARAKRYVANARPIDAADGRRLGAVAVLHDVTDRHRAEVLQQVQLAVAGVLSDADTPEQAAAGTLAAVATALDWACGEFWQADPDTDTIDRVGTWTLPGYDLSDVTGSDTFSLARGNGLAGIVWDTGAELWIPEVAEDVRTVARRDQARRAGLHTAIGLPVRSDKRILGVLLFFSIRVEEPDEELMRMLDGVCAHLGRHIERRRAEALSTELAAARRDFERVVSQVNDYVWTLELHADGSATSVYASPDATGVLGAHLPEGTDMATIITSYVHPEDARALTLFRAGIRAGRPADVEVRLIGLDGEIRWVWTRAVARTGDGRRFVDGISTNTTDRRKLVEQREQLLADQQQQNRRLRDLDRIKDELVGMVSHELRNPLAVIRGYSEMLVDDSGLDTDQRHLVRVIDQHSAHMQSLVDDLLDLARLDAGQLTIDPRPVALSKLIGDAVDAQRHAAQAKELTVRIDTPKRLPVYADPTRLRQVLDNLLSNAVKYTPAGGAVTITGRLEPAGDGGRPPGVVIEVIDTGIGIPLEQQPHLFERFFRAANAVDHGIKGTGLGLAITKAIVDAHQGTIAARSAPAGGTLFTVTLPDTAP